MDSDWQIYACISLVAALTSAGGLAIASRKPIWYNEKRMWWLIAIGTGLLFAILFLEFLPHALHQAGHQAPLLMMAGVFFILFMETYIAPKLTFWEGEHCDHDHSRDHDHKHHPENEHQHHVISHQAACSVIGCLIICSFFDGFSIKSAFAIDAQTGWLTSIGLFIHVLPDGVIAASISLAGGMRKSKAMGASFLTGASLIAGALIASFIDNVIGLSELLIPFASGILLYVSLIHLLPTGMKHHKGLWWVLAGSLPFAMLHLFALHPH